MDGERGYMQIGEVAERTGLTHRTLRYYEEKGLLKPPSRMEGGFRLYSEEDVQRLELIKRLRSLLGFSLAEIKEMVDAEETRTQLKAEYRQELDTGQRRERLRRAIEVTEFQVGLINQKLEQLREMRNYCQEKLSHYRDMLKELENTF